MISSLASKCQDFKVKMPFFQPLYVMKLKTSKFKVLAFWCQWKYHYQIECKFKSQGLYTIKIKYWKASGSSSSPSLIPNFWNIGILHGKQAKLRKVLQHSVNFLFWYFKDHANWYAIFQICNISFRLFYIHPVYLALSDPCCPAWFQHQRGYGGSRGSFVQVWYWRDWDE